MTISGSPLGSPATIVQMLEFAARHGIEPNVEIFPLDRVNEAIAKLENESSAHRLVLKVG